MRGYRTFQKVTELVLGLQTSNKKFSMFCMVVTKVIEVTDGYRTFRKLFYIYIL
jgi:hypothetical protein